MIFNICSEGHYVVGAFHQIIGRHCPRYQISRHFHDRVYVESFESYICYPIALAPRDYAINSCSEQTCQQQKPTKFICDRDFLISPVFIKYLETALLVPNRLWL
jgi:hypothetical protein